MTPTRQPRKPDLDEELILYALLIVVGVIPVAIAVVRRAIFGFDATLGLLMACAGIVGVLLRVGRSRRNRTT